MLLKELYLVESLGRGGWFDTTNGKYHDLYFDIQGQTHDEYLSANPEKFKTRRNSQNPLSDALDAGWVRVVYPESSVRGPNVPPWLGVEGSLKGLRAMSLRRYVNRFIKDYDVDRVIVDVINPNNMMSGGHHTFNMPYERSKMNTFFAG